MSGIGMALGAVSLFGRFPRVAALFAKIPRQAWEALAVVAYVLALVALHQHYVHAAIAAAKAEQKVADDAAWQGAIAKERQAAEHWRAVAEADQAAISTKQRTQNDEENRRIAAGADDLRLHGPGKAAAACARPGDGPGLPAAAGRPQPASGAANDAGALLPGGDGAADRAVVPWGWLTGRGEQCDLDRAENLTWRSWWKLEAAARAAAIARAPQLDKGNHP